MSTFPTQDKNGALEYGNGKWGGEENVSHMESRKCRPIAKSSNFLLLDEFANLILGLMIHGSYVNNF